MKTQIGRRDHHHVVYHQDHGEVFGEGSAPLRMDQILENIHCRCRNTGINALNLHITGATRHFLGIADYELTTPPFKHLGHWNIYETIRHHRDRGVNVLEQIRESLRELGTAFWVGLRVNDIRRRHVR